MSPLSRPSKVDALKRGLGTAGPAALDTPEISTRGGDLPAEAPRPQPVKPARVTLNLPPDLYRELVRWTGAAAEAIDVPRVGVQEALRAMVRVVAGGQARNAEQQILAAIREELAS